MSIKPLTAFALSLGLGASSLATAADKPTIAKAKPEVTQEELHSPLVRNESNLLQTKVAQLRKHAPSFSANDLREELNDLVDLFKERSLISNDEARDIKDPLIQETTDADLHELADNLFVTFAHTLSEALKEYKVKIATERRASRAAEEKEKLLLFLGYSELVSPAELKKLAKQTLIEIRGYERKAQRRDTLIKTIKTLDDIFGLFDPAMKERYEPEVRAIKKKSLKDKDINETLERLEFLRFKMLAALKGHQVASNSSSETHRSGYLESKGSRQIPRHFHNSSYVSPVAGNHNGHRAFGQQRYST